jgi:hypothetical protein
MILNAQLHVVLHQSRYYVYYRSDDCISGQGFRRNRAIF